MRVSLALLESKHTVLMRSLSKRMGGELNSWKRGRLAILAISVAWGGLIFVHTFVLKSGFLLAFFVGIALYGIIGWVSITRADGVKVDRAKSSLLEFVGKRGIVVEECSPEGRVRIGEVTWSAISYDGITLRVGERITVQDMQALKLAVKAEPSSMPTHH